MNDALSAMVALMLVSAAPAAMAQDQKSPHPNKEQAIERMFQNLDADKSGAIETAEADAFAQKRFQRLDADGDGVVTREEAAAVHGKRDVPEAKRQKVEEWRTKRFQALDADGDGKVTLAEVKAKETQMFAKADANGDGKITKDELASGWGQHGKRGSKQ